MQKKDDDYDLDDLMNEADEDETEPDDEQDIYLGGRD